MFNDELSNQQCKILLSRLAACAFPFQCAHGRPSMVPLVELEMFSEHGLSDGAGSCQSQEHFGAAFKKWKHEMVE
jgi:DNA mismatch repair protein MLH3